MHGPEEAGADEPRCYSVHLIACPGFVLSPVANERFASRGILARNISLFTATATGAGIYSAFLALYL
jgi:hypothetical protein